MNRALFPVEGVRNFTTIEVMLLRPVAQNAWAFLSDCQPADSDQNIGLRPGFEYRYFRQYPVTATKEGFISVDNLKWVEFYPSYDPAGTVLRIQGFEHELWSILITTEVSASSRLRDTFCNEAFGFSER